MELEITNNCYTYNRNILQTHKNTQQYDNPNNHPNLTFSPSTTTNIITFITHINHHHQQQHQSSSSFHLRTRTKFRVIRINIHIFTNIFNTVTKRNVRFVANFVSDWFLFVSLVFDFECIYNYRHRYKHLSTYNQYYNLMYIISVSYLLNDICMHDSSSHSLSLSLNHPSQQYNIILQLESIHIVEYIHRIMISHTQKQKHIFLSRAKRDVYIISP